MPPVDWWTASCLSGSLAGFSPVDGPHLGLDPTRTGLLRVLTAIQGHQFDKYRTNPNLLKYLQSCHWRGYVEMCLFDRSLCTTSFHHPTLPLYHPHQSSDGQTNTN